MKPYYDEGGIVIYHGDCSVIAPALGLTFDLLCTDPPYGIADAWKGGFGSGWGKARKESVARNQWDRSAPSRDLLNALISTSRDAILWGGNYFELPPSRGWLVWNKPERGFSLAEAELAWTNRDAVIRVFDHHRSDSGREHPTQKPLRLMTWCLSQFPDAHSVFDPFAGSGTTLVAAKQLGRRAVGIELEERYCEIAARRLGQGVLAFGGTQ